ncbi:MAG: hypothetical protein IPO94_11375 [Saprospiraceae bacterium]|nr:hypothetical protein [Saprospiraceae bacterium]
MISNLYKDLPDISSIDVIVPPKAPAPLVEVPTPRWIWILFTEDIISGKSTKNVLGLSVVSGTPLIITLICV